jgi:hypothetical protein
MSMARGRHDIRLEHPVGELRQTELHGDAPGVPYRDAIFARILENKKIVNTMILITNW